MAVSFFRLVARPGKARAAMLGAEAGEGKHAGAQGSHMACFECVSASTGKPGQVKSRNLNYARVFPAYDKIGATCLRLLLGPLDATAAATTATLVQP